jgi:hypothetical protein
VDEFTDLMLYNNRKNMLFLPVCPSSLFGNNQTCSISEQKQSTNCQVIAYDLPLIKDADGPLLYYDRSKDSVYMQKTDSGEFNAKVELLSHFLLSSNTTNQNYGNHQINSKIIIIGTVSLQVYITSRSEAKI